MLSGTTIGLAIGYSIALFLEIFGVSRRFVAPRALLAGVTLTSAMPHGLYLLQNTTPTSAPPLSTAGWLLWAAWLLAIVYLAALFYLPRTPTGIVLLPIVLILLLSSHWASSEPLAAERSFYIWGALHGMLLLAGSVAVCIGFLAGLMYLAQSYGLKHAHSAINNLRLPSLEWLERVNSRTLGLSAVLIALGFVSGVVMSLVIHRGEAAYRLWSDPVVLSLAAMLLWLVAAEVFRLVYPAARRGRKVAYLTLASFVFLIIALASFTLLDTVHAPNRRDNTHEQSRADVDPQFAIRNPRSTA